MNNFRELNVWKKAVQLATAIYEVTINFPKEETYGLTSQIRRCVVSIGSNIAEGAGRSSDKEFKYFLNIAAGSCYELETQLTIARNLEYVSEEKFAGVLESVIEIQKMIYALKKALVE